MYSNILETSHVVKSYLIDSKEICILDNICLTVRAGEFIVIEGKSGSGKSTLLSILSGLDRPDKGTIKLDGIDITDLSEDELAPFRIRTIGYIFQSFHLVPSLTAMENIMFPAELNRNSQAEAKARDLLKHVDMIDRRNNFPHQLSGGEKQRVAICRSLVNNPQIVFADEPTGNLDSANSKVILELLLELRREFNTTLLLATHSRDISTRADRVVQLTDGRIKSASDPDLVTC